MEQSKWFLVGNGWFNSNQNSQHPLLVQEPPLPLAVFLHKTYAHSLCPWQNAQGKCKGNAWKEGKDEAILHLFPLILHPILHPKSPDFIGILPTGCRKCRFFPKTFFCGDEWCVICVSRKAPHICRFMPIASTPPMTGIPELKKKKKRIQSLNLCIFYMHNHIKCCQIHFFHILGFLPSFSRHGIIQTSLAFAHMAERKRSIIFMGGYAT